jgi:hypothetical protein
MDAQLQQLIELQAEQNQLLKRHLWRLRFSLLTLLLLTTATCCGLGVVIYRQEPQQRVIRVPVAVPPVPTPAPIAPYATPGPAAPFAIPPSEK